MAVIKIKNIKSNLQAVINYGKNGDKTENGILVSSVNCSVDTAYEEMALTKKFFHKEDNILGYHIIQSFKGNEVSPKLSNQIGKELAEELWGDKYSVEGIKERIYGYTKENLPPVKNVNNKYYKKIYTGPKLNKFLLKTSSFYRLYVHYLYAFGKLPAKNEYKELSSEYYKQKRKNNMIFEEINFLARLSFTSIADVTIYKANLDNKLPELKGKRELLWRNHKTADETNRANILKEINSLTEEIDKIQAQKNACNRIISRYKEIKIDFQKEHDSIEKSKTITNG